MLLMMAIVMVMVNVATCKYNGDKCSTASECGSKRCVDGICRGALIKLYEACVDKCEAINAKCIGKGDGKQYCDNIILNSCLPECGGLCQKAETDSIAMRLFNDCLGRFDDCRDLSIDYCDKQYYWCLPSVKSAPCIVDYSNDVGLIKSEVKSEFKIEAEVEAKVEVSEDGCYAPPTVYGGKCDSMESLLGDDTTTITYQIDPTSDATQVICQGLGAGQEGGDCSWGWYDIGSGGIEMMWGANAASPSIQCYGMPLGTTLTWSWSSGTASTGSCGIFKSEKKVVTSDNKKEVELVALLSGIMIGIMIVLGIIALVIYKRQLTSSYETIV